MNTDNPIICPVCHNAEINSWAKAFDYEYFTTNKEYTYYNCNSCDTIFLRPVPENELKIIYPQNYYSFNPGKKNWAEKIKKWLDKRILKKILNRLPADKFSVLDVGGGTGWLCDLIKEMEKRVEFTQVVDIDAMAKDAAIKKGHKYFEGRIEDFTTDKKFDFILLLNLIEHVAHPSEVLQQLENLLTQDGIILIKTPNILSMDARIFRSTYWGGLHCPRHWTLFSENSFKKMLEKTNLQTDSLNYTQGGPFWAFSIIAWLTKKKILKTDKSRPIVFHPLYPFISSLFAAFDFIRRPFAKTSQMFILLKKR